MRDFFGTVFAKWEGIRKGSSPVPSIESIPPENCLPKDSAGYLIKAEQMYFTVRINQMHLAANRNWWVVFDPLVVVVVEFDYGAGRIAIPKIIGPALIPDPVKGESPQFGVVVEDELVVGPHPYRGGDVTISVRFYQLAREDLARSILSTIGSLSKAIAGLKELETAANVGEAILTGIEGLLRLKTTVCLAAYRGSLAPAVYKPFRAQSAALITPPGPNRPSDLKVISGRLHTDGPAGPEHFRESDFVLFSVEGMPRREDLKPFSARKNAALKAVLSGADGLTRAKSLLLTVYNDMLDSPDIIDEQVEEAYDKWISELRVRKENFDRRSSMSGEAPEPLRSEDRLARAIKALDF